MKKKTPRRRVEIFFRLEEAQAVVELIEDTLDLIVANAWVESGDREAAFVHRVKRALGKLRIGIDYVTKVNPTRTL